MPKIQSDISLDISDVSLQLLISCSYERNWMPFNSWANYCPDWKQLRASLDRHLVPRLFGQPRSMSICCVLYLSSHDGLNRPTPLTPLLS